MRPVIFLLSLLGVALFGSVFALSFASPLLIERSAREIVRIEVERKVGGQIETLSNSRIAGLAQRALQKTGVEIEHAQRAIRDELPRKVANVVADMPDGDAPDRQQNTLAAHATLNGSSLASHMTKTSATGVLLCGNPSLRSRRRCWPCLHASRLT